MTFLPQYSQMMFVQMELSEYQHRSQVLTMKNNANQREVMRIEEEYSIMYAGDEAKGYDTDPYYKQLARDSQIIEQQQSAVTLQVQALEKMIESLQKDVTNGIKTACASQISS